MLTVPNIIKNKYTSSLFALSLVILVSAFFITQLNLFESSNLLIIHLDVFTGADFFGTYNDVLGILGVAAIIWLINLILANEFYLKERFLSYLLSFSTLVFTVLILLAVNVIISIN
ncbi:hypothetical protein GW950_01780 [Candidatus Wolfebacteria bacterium]|nr:hypothetical protein [Candidatus Wolfebacteria bacterium]